MSSQQDFGTRIYLRLGLALIILIAVNAVGFFTIQSFSAWVGKRSQLRQISLQLERLLALTTDAEAAQRGFLLTRNPAFLEPYHEATAKIDQQLVRLSNAAANDADVALNIGELQLLVSARVYELEKVLSLARSEAPSDLPLSRGKQLMDSIRQGIDSRQTQVTYFIDGADQKIARQLALSRWMLLLGSACTVLLVAVAFLQLEKEMRRRAQAETAVEELNRKLRAQVTELDALNKELESFSYSVSHDLRAPLRHINGYVDLLNDSGGPQLDGKNRRYLSIVGESARKMGRLIDDLLVFSRMGRTEIKKTLVAVDELARQVIHDLEPETRNRNIIWKIRSLPSVGVDRAMFYQALFNLIANAVKYTRPRDPAEIEVGCREGSADDLVFFVRDNGVGFDMRYADKLFGVFQRLHRTDEFEGTGIGLANVRRIIHRHGGHTWAEGKLNEGATFYFTLPRSSKTEQAITDRNGVIKPSGSASKKEEDHATIETHSAG